MKRYHKSNVGDTGHGTRHPRDDVEYDDTLSAAEFRATYGAPAVEFGENINLDVAHIQGRVAACRCGEHGGRLVVCVVSEERDEVEVSTGTAVQDMDGYRWEAGE